MGLKITISICIFAIFAIIGIYFYKWINNLVGNAQSWMGIIFWGIFLFLGIGTIFFISFYLIALILEELVV